ncbi:hypothetical protein DQ353_00310 [Arthrobacter sp. AQ5-05]|uniref:hypothetical protein n=1 Tax=Arthrobacter sp. AQ5-05 TaxID=2184581 RepID=UPI000DCF62D8|nr:hypothetical protein [Arthrobacter sp. AQ5-05]RAX50880.1 hypothetical protein DQ353_00310 [Arthrobacter sp. AQ5-05]
MSTESIKVESVGEDGGLWIVTGTSDAHSADEAVREHEASLTGENLEGSLGFEYRTDWGWRPGWNTDDPMDEALLTHGFSEFYMPRFDGFLVTA